MKNAVSPQANVISLSRAIWAVDAHSRDFDLQSKPVLGAQLILGELAPIEPIYVLRDDETNLSIEIFTVEGTAQFPEGEKNVSELASYVGLPSILPARFLPRSGNSVRGAVREFLCHAANKKSRLIALSFANRKRHSWLKKKTFGERLIRESKIPLLTCNHYTEIPSHIGEILFVTDFSTASREFYSGVLSIARRDGARVVLLHNKKTVLKNAIPIEAAKWIEIASAVGVKTELIALRENVEDSVLVEARQLNQGLLALGFHSDKGHPYSSTTAINVARSSTLPVFLRRLT